MLFPGLVSTLQDAVSAIDAAGDYFVSQQEIADLRANLTGLIADLESQAPPATAGRVFGESTGGAFVAHHTEVAERHVRQAVTEIGQGLTDFREAVAHAERLAVETDGDVSERWRSLAAAPLIVDQTRVASGAGALGDPDFRDG